MLVWVRKNYIVPSWDQKRGGISNLGGTAVPTWSWLTPYWTLRSSTHVKSGDLHSTRATPPQ